VGLGGREVATGTYCTPGEALIDEETIKKPEQEAGSDGGLSEETMGRREIKRGGEQQMSVQGITPSSPLIATQGRRETKVISEERQSLWH